MMSLLSDNLSVWAIGFRWAGLDPDRVWLRIPLPVRDHFRNIMNAILKAELSCTTISLEKPSRNPELSPEFSIYRYLDDVNYCIGGLRFNRKLLRWADVDRYDFKLWCDRRGIELPEFWFPRGWKLEYELPEDELLPGHGYMRRDQLSKGEPDEEGTAQERLNRPEVGPTETEGDRGAALTSDSPGTDTAESGASGRAESEEKLRNNQRARIACQEIAKGIWREHPDRTIASVVKDELIQKYGGASHYADVTVREWIKVVAPAHVRQKRGRPRSQNGAEDD